MEVEGKEAEGTGAAGTVEAAGPEAVEGVTGLAMEAEAPAWEADCAGTAHPYRSASNSVACDFEPDRMRHVFIPEGWFSIIVPSFIH